VYIIKNWCRILFEVCKKHRILMKNVKL